MFLPITDWTQRYYFNGTDTTLGQNLHMFTNNKDTNMELMYLDAPGLFRFIKNTFHK